MKEFWRRVYQLLEQGWTQGYYAISSNGEIFDIYTAPIGSCFCLEGAIYRVMADMKKGRSSKPALAFAKKIIQEKYRGQYQSIPDFNDAHGRTKEEVLEIVKLCEEAYPN